MHLCISTQEVLAISFYQISFCVRCGVEARLLHTDLLKASLVTRLASSNSEGGAHVPAPIQVACYMRTPNF